MTYNPDFNGTPLLFDVEYAYLRNSTR